MNEKKRSFGDRRDGRRIRDLDAIHKAMPYIMPRRCDAEVYLNEIIDVSEVLKYITKRNEIDPDHKITLFHVILAAIAKTIVHRPYLNRFISGRRYYEREIVSFSFVAKKQFTDKGEESLMILKANGDSTLDEISDEIIGGVKEVRETGGNELDGVIDWLVKLPRPILRIFATCLSMLEYYGRVPAFLADMLPYYATVLVANLGSIKCGAPYHHLMNFGTNSVMITIGELHKEYTIDADGKQVLRDVVEMGFTLDERIGDGFYFAKSIRFLKYLLANPELLEKPFKEEVVYHD